MNTRKLLLWIGLPVLIIGFLSCSKCDKKYSSADLMVEEMSSDLEAITVDVLKTKIDSFEMFYLIDVREANEHYYGFIPGSIHICCGTIAFQMDNANFWDNEMIYSPEKTDEIVIYCKKGKRSVVAASMLERLGYENVKYVDGGWKKWELSYPLHYEKKLEQLGHQEEEEETGGC
jgi:rhodanese-related sulfurtransferase